MGVPAALGSTCSIALNLDTQRTGSSDHRMSPRDGWQDAAPERVRVANSPAEAEPAPFADASASTTQSRRGGASVHRSPGSRTPCSTVPATSSPPSAGRELSGRKSGGPGLLVGSHASRHCTRVLPRYHGAPPRPSRTLPCVAPLTGTKTASGRRIERSMERTPVCTCTNRSGAHCTSGSSILVMATITFSAAEAFISTASSLLCDVGSDSPCLADTTRMIT
mmetsp:Transcript_57270/g.167612  ORF Transcript_57270/g.167612 Transcript_57270/m.167612 type:complete len:222 (-) Transcript_57270:286-951(-)